MGPLLFHGKSIPCRYPWNVAQDMRREVQRDWMDIPMDLSMEGFMRYSMDLTRSPIIVLSMFSMRSTLFP